MEVSKLWKISNTTFREITFQSIYERSIGATLLQKKEESVKKMIRGIKVNMWINKAIISFFS